MWRFKFACFIRRIILPESGYTPQRPELHLDYSVQKVFELTCYAPELVYTAESCAAPGCVNKTVA
jgi:hypothetical protein